MDHIWPNSSIQWGATVKIIVVLVPEETVARGAEQSQASNPDIIPTFGRLAAHTNIEIFIPPGAESAGTVVIGIFNHQG